MKTTARKSIPVTQANTLTAASVRMSDSAEREALTTLGISLSERPSEAEALHALLDAGCALIANAAREQALRAGYAAWASDVGIEDHACGTGMRLRGERRFSSMGVGE